MPKTFIEYCDDCFMRDGTLTDVEVASVYLDRVRCHECAVKAEGAGAPIDA